MNLTELATTFDRETHDSFKKYVDLENDKLNKNILKELNLSKKETNEMLKKIKNYKYVDEINDLKYGAFIRWIPLSDPDNLVFHHAGMICEVKFTDEGTIITCKNFMHRHYTLKMDECLIFQKFTNEEKMLIEMIDQTV
jgi:hypothetical protein